MIIPKKIKIGGHYVEVKISSVDTVGNMGGYNYGKQVIIIDKSVNESQTEETLLHEIVEAINLMYEFGLPHDKIQTLGCVLHQIIKDNPKMFENKKKDKVKKGKRLK